MCGAVVNVLIFDVIVIVVDERKKASECLPGGQVDAVWREMALAGG